ncbi:MAG: MMPL family transporter, partial [Gaiellaceae bacterium]
MKTRIIQNEPEEPTNGSRTLGNTAGEPKRSTNIAARMGRWSASHKKTAIFGWLAFIAVAFMIGNAVGTKQLDPKKSGSGESGHVDSVLHDEFKQDQGDQVLIQSTTRTVDDPSFRAAIADVTRTVDGMKPVKKIRSPFAPGHEDLISKDRHSALVSIELRTTDAAKAKALDAPVEKAIIAAAARHPGIAIEEFGVNSETQVDNAVKSDFKKAGVFSVPVTLIILVIAFGALI